MLDVIGIGTNSVDEVLGISSGIQSLAVSGKARVLQRQTLPGGQTATAMCACALLGLRSGYIGVFGSDDNGRLIRQALQERGVDLTCATGGEGPNRSAVVLVDPDGRRAVLWHRPDRLRLAPSQLGPEALSARVLHVDDDDGAVALAVSRLAARAGTPVTSDIEHLNEDTEALVASVTYPILEQGLLAALTGEVDPEGALRKLRRLTPRVLSVTLGDRGAAVLDGDAFHHTPAFAVAAADTTGAGDVFRAGFIYGVLKGWTPPDILRFANAAAAVSCTRPGAIPSVPSLDEVTQFLKRR